VHCAVLCDCVVVLCALGIVHLRIVHVWRGVGDVLCCAAVLCCLCCACITSWRLSSLHARGGVGAGLWPVGAVLPAHAVVLCFPCCGMLWHAVL
jgi:hypothetical protein